MDKPELIFTYNKRGNGFKARCSACGKLLRNARECNRAGLNYAEVGVKEDFEKHKNRCRSKAIKSKAQEAE